MPRIPTIVSQQGIEGAIGAQPFQDPRAAAAPMRALAGTGQALEHSALQVHDVYATVAAQQRKAAASLELETKIDELKQAFANAQVDVRRSGVAPKDYFDVSKDALGKAETAVAKTFQYPEAQAQFQVRALKLRSQAIAEARNEGFKLLDAEMETVAGVQQVEDANTVVFGATPAVREEAYARTLGRIQNLQRLGVYSGPQATAKILGFLGTIEEGAARRDFNNPVMRLQTVDNLLNGRLQHMDPDKQLVLGNQMMDKMLADAKTNDTAANQVFTDLKHDALSSLSQQYQDGEIDGATALTKLNIARTEYRLSDIEYDRMRKVITQDPKDAASDPRTLSQVIQGIYTINPRVSESQLDRFHDQGLLNTKDWREAKNHLASVTRANRNEARAIANTSQAQAEQEIRAALKIPALYTKLDDTQDQLYSQALQELSRRSQAFREGGGEDPLKIAREMIPRLRAALGEKSLDNADALKKLATFGSKEELDAWYATQPKTKENQAKYDVQLRYLRQIRDAENLADQQRANEGFNRPTGSGRRQ